ncbi:uncharacterized protein LOC129615881 [Condylostylus longicornis]|uniref:uncharacterized protein LOC129615881 n=1 Tax=Condylostylus longicornis TaxID=2530218 RepID=UPI00244E45C6|nr:uncharacterized protein LOC129615881 [Condylostylus longicornis]
MDWRRFINESLISRLIILTLLIRMGYTLKCYVCDSELNSTCAKINKESKMKPQTCTWESINDPPNTLLGELSHVRLDTRYLIQEGINDENLTQDVLNFACVKIISSDGGGRQMIHRSCQIKSDDFCQMVTGKAWEKSQFSHEPLEIVDCSTCNDKDNCNGAKQFKLHFILIIISIIITSIYF